MKRIKCAGSGCIFSLSFMMLTVSRECHKFLPSLDWKTVSAARLTLNDQRSHASVSSRWRVENFFKQGEEIDTAHHCSSVIF